MIYDAFTQKPMRHHEDPSSEYAIQITGDLESWKLEGWARTFIETAEVWQKRSKDPSTQVGASAGHSCSNALLAVGYNCFPRGIQNLEERWERPQKYEWVEHAERNLIYNCARHGIALEGATLFLTYDPWPCAPCARGVIQSGIARIIATDRPFPGKGDWEEKLDIGREMLKEAGVACYYIDT